ncbi:putative FAD dependent oxidoreductase [Sarocladium strictum]
MRLSAASISAICAFSVASADAASSDFDASKFKPEDIIERDVAVIGGGSSSTYAAIAVKDAGKSVIVVEKKARMGGHASTYTDAETNKAVDMGIIIFHNITEVRDFYDRFDLPLSPSDSFLNPALHFDFRTGKEVTPAFQSTPEEMMAAFGRYMEVYNKYPELMNGTLLPDPVPKELYQPFGDLIEEHELHAAVPPMYFYNPGVGNIPVSRNVSEIFAKAEAELLSDSSVLLSSVVTKADRPENDSDVKLVVHTPEGSELIIAKKLIIAIPPKLDYLAPFDLSKQESSLFCKYINSGYYVGVLAKSGFTDDAAITSSVAGNTVFQFPNLPAAYSFAGSPIPGLQLVTYATEQTSRSEPMTDDEVMSEVIASVKRLQKENPDLYEDTEPEFVDFHSHAPYSLQVRAEDIKNGFYDKLSLLWKYTKDHVIPEVLAGL